jgi:Reverse transcriptase (RNA-dependent DNA polymerase)
MLKNRTVRAEIRGESSMMEVRRGCPQGGVLSPLLWNMVIAGFLRSLKNQGLWAQGFADDVDDVQWKILGHGVRTHAACLVYSPRVV